MSKEYIVEFKPHGRYVRVTAIDPETGMEVVIVGDARESQQVLTRNAINKLEFMMKKN